MCHIPDGYMSWISAPLSDCVHFVIATAGGSLKPAGKPSTEVCWVSAAAAHQNKQNLTPARRRRSPVFEEGEEYLFGGVFGWVYWQFLLSFQKIGSDLVREHPANKCLRVKEGCL